MTTIASALVGSQFGIESTPGTAVAAAKKFPTLNMKMAPQANFTEYTSEGVLVPVAHILGEEWASGDLDGPVDYNESPYIYNNGLVHATRAQIDLSGGWKGIWIPSATTVGTTDSWTVERGDGQASLATKYAYVQVLDLAINATRKKFARKGKVIGRRVTTAVSMTATPTTIARQPALPQTIDFYLAASWAGLTGAAIVTGGWEVDINLFSGRFAPTWPLDSSQTSFKELLAAAIKPKVKISMAVNSQSYGLFTTMRNGDLIWMRLKATGPQIGLDATPAPVYYTEQHDLCLQVSKIPEDKDHEKAYSYDIEFSAVPDPARTSNWYECTNINALASL